MSIVVSRPNSCVHLMMDTLNILIEMVYYFSDDYVTLLNYTLFRIMKKCKVF